MNVARMEVRVKLNNEKIILSGVPIEVAEFETYKLATFLISVLDEYDLYKRMIPKESGELYHSTIVGFPILAKLVTDYAGNPIDFTGHEMKIVVGKDGKPKAKFGTTAIGSVVKSWIEDREVAGYDGEKSCIMIQAKLWTDRYPEYFKVLDKLWADGNVKSSWEIRVAEYVKTSAGKILKVFSFIGNTLLGTKHIGAVPGAGVYEYAEMDKDCVEVELAEALSRDMVQASAVQSAELIEEDKILKNTDKVQAPIVEPVENVPAVSEVDSAIETPTEVANDTEVSALTEWDLRKKIQNACRAKLDKWCWISFHFPLDKTVWVEVEDRTSELDFVMFTYDGTDDEIVLSEPTPVKLVAAVRDINSAIAERDAALIKANEKIQSLNSDIAELQPFKEKFEQAECERIEAETEAKRNALAEYACKSGFIAKEELESDNQIKACVAELDEAGIKTIIAERFMKSLDGEPDAAKSTEVAEASHKNEVVKANVFVDDAITPKSFVQAYIGKKN